MVEPIAVVVEPIGWTPPLTIVANSHRAADEVVVEQIGRESQLKVLHGRAHQGIAVAYQNLTAPHRVPKPRGKDRRDRIHFGPDKARDSTLGPLPPVRPSPRLDSLMSLYPLR